MDEVRGGVVMWVGGGGACTLTYTCINVYVCVHVVYKRVLTHEQIYVSIAPCSWTAYIQSRPYAQLCVLSCSVV